MSVSIQGTTYVMEYIAAAAKRVYQDDARQLKFSTIQEVLRDEGTKMANARDVERGKIWRDYEKLKKDPDFMKEATEKTVSAMTRWGFLEKLEAPRNDRLYMPTNDLKMIGRQVEEDTQNYKWSMLNTILRNAANFPLVPSRLLIKIREYEPRISIPGVPGLDNRGIVPILRTIFRDEFEFSEYDFDMLISWGQFFELIDVFDPKILDIVAPKQLYLTCNLASMQELSQVVNKIPSIKHQAIQSKNQEDALSISKSLTTSENSLEVSLEASVLRARDADDWVHVISEYQASRGVDPAEIIQSSKEQFVVAKRTVELSTFKQTIIFWYRFLRKRSSISYVWIAQLKALCCRKLRITRDQFDKLLVEFYRADTEKIEFSTAAGDIVRLQRRVYEKPFRLYGKVYRIIRIEDSSIE